MLREGKTCARAMKNEFIDTLLSSSHSFRSPSRQPPICYIKILSSPGISVRLIKLLLQDKKLVFLWGSWLTFSIISANIILLASYSCFTELKLVFVNLITQTNITFLYKITYRSPNMTLCIVEIANNKTYISESGSHKPQ